MEATTDLFINIIRQHRTIYDTTIKDFKNIHKKEDKWIQIAIESRMSVEAAKKRYFSLRQKYSREKKKEITCARTKQTFRPSVFFDRLTFLDDFIKPRRTYTNDVDGIDSPMYEDEFPYEDDQNDDSVSRLIGDDPSHRLSIQRRPLNSAENGGCILFGDELSLEEEAAMDQQLLNEMAQDSANESQTPQGGYFEILDEGDSGSTPQDVLSTHTADGVQTSGSDDGMYSTDVGDSSSNNINETLRLRAILPEDMQQLYQRQPSNGLSLSRSTHFADERHLQPPLNVIVLPADVQGHYQRQPSIGFSPNDPSSNDIAGQRNIQPNETGGIQSNSIIRRSIDTQQSNCVSVNDRNVQARMTQGCGRPDRISNFPDRSNQVERVPQTASYLNRNEMSIRKRPSSTVTSSSLSKNSPVVQAAVSARQHEKSGQNQSTSKVGSMDAIKEKMESYLKACNDKLLKKPERSPHASFLSYLGTKMEKVPAEKIESLEKEILDIVFRFSRDI